MESILTSIKKLLGIVEEYTHFDTDIIVHINTVLSILTQIGVGPSSGFSITDKTAVWSDFIGDLATIEFVKSYVYLKVKLIFDPPQSSAAIEAINKTISELESRISYNIE
jgi:accessory colonization factor AcfC